MTPAQIDACFKRACGVIEVLAIRPSGPVAVKAAASALEVIAKLASADAAALRQELRTVAPQVAAGGR